MRYAVETRYCPKCGKAATYIPGRNGYFCNSCRIPVDGGAGATQSADLSDVPAFSDEIPAEFREGLPAEPPSEVTLYSPTSDLKPIVKRSSLRRGQIEALAEVETRAAASTGDFLILSKLGRTAIVAARKVFGEDKIIPLAVEMPGAPWKLQIASGQTTIDIGLFKARDARQSSPGYGMMQPAAVMGDFYICTLTLKGAGRELARYVYTLLRMLDPPPWASQHWNSLAQAMNLPSSKMQLDWQKYLGYASARIAAGDLGAARTLFDESLRSGISSPAAAQVLSKARSELMAGDYDAARETVRSIKMELEKSQSQRTRLREMQTTVTLITSEIKKLEPENPKPDELNAEMTALVTDASIKADAAFEKSEGVVLKASEALFSLNVNRANALLSSLQAESPDLARQLRGALQTELETGRRLLEAGQIEEGAASLTGALQTATQRADAVLAQTAGKAIEGLRALWQSGGSSSPVFTGEQRTRYDEKLTELGEMARSGRAAEAGRLARALHREIADRLESSAPELRVSFQGPPLTSNSWNRIVMKVTNTGTADARSIRVTFGGTLEMQAVDAGYSIRAGEVHNDEVAVRSASYGQIPVKLRVDCERASDAKPFRFEAELWLDFKQSLDLSGAKTIMIDRSVHIQDSVLSRTNVGGEGELDGLPGGTADGVQAGGKTEINDSIMSRSNRPSAAAAAVNSGEKKCPSCGTMISTEWKRCPFCS